MFGTFVRIMLFHAHPQVFSASGVETPICTFEYIHVPVGIINYGYFLKLYLCNSLKFS